jgi:TPR repeat protein
MGLGYMYWNGLGMQRDVGKGLELWRASAARGNTQAQKYIDDVPWWTRAGLTIEQWFKR